MGKEDYEILTIISEIKNGKIESYLQGRIPIMNNQKYQDFNSLTDIESLKNYGINEKKFSLIKKIISNNIQILKKSGKKEIKTELK